MPFYELCFLEKFGRAVIGKIDPKYIVGVIPNYNGCNKKITLSKEDVIKAKERSIKNPPASITPNSKDDLFLELQKRFKTITKEKMDHSISIEQENIMYEINEELISLTSKKSTKPINISKEIER